MRSLIFMFLLFPSIACRADDLDSHIEKLRETLEKNKACKLAVLSVPNDPETRKIQMMGRLVPTEVLCVGDLTVSKGTLNEKSGCGVVVIDLKNLNIRPFFNRLGHDFEFTKTSCENGGFEELMARKFIVPGQIGTNLARWFSRPELLGEQTLAIVYSKKTYIQKLLGKKSKYEEWLEAEQAKAL